MNKSFKVVFNKARGALMVVNEVTSSVQAKGTKTVIAAAVTLMAGVAVAAPEVSTTPEVEPTVSQIPEVPAEGVTTTDKKIDWADVKTDGQYHYTNAGGQSAFTTLVKDKGDFSGKLWVSASGKKADATGLEVTGEGVELTNKGEIYVSTDAEGTSWQNEAMLAENGAKAVNANKIVVKNAYGMRVGRSAPAKIENAGTIIVEEQGVGMELGGGSQSVGSEATNNGSIIVGDIAEGKFGHGVLIKDAKDVVFNNNGLIQAGEGATAIEVKLDGDETSGTINLGQNSKVDGLIKIGEGTKIGLVAKGMNGKLQVQAAEGTTTLGIEDGANVELVDGQKSVYENVNVNKGTLTASIWKNDNHMKDVVVGEEGVFNIKKLNSGGKADNLEAKPHDTLLLSSMDVTLDGGDLQVAGKTYTGKVKIGVSKVASRLTVNKGTYRFDDLSFGSSFKEPSDKRSVLEVAVGGTLAVGNLDFSNGEVKVGGQLNADKLVWEDKKYGNAQESGPVGTLTVDAEGVLSTVAKDNLVTKTEDGKWEKTEAANHLTNNGTLEITDAFSAKAEDVKEYLAQAETAFGEVVFKNVTLTDEKVEWDPELGMITLNTTVAMPKADDQGAVSANLQGNDVGVAALEVAKDTKSVKVEGDGSLTIRGDTASGNVFEGVATLEKAEVSNLVLGYEATNKGVVNAKTLKATELDVVGDFTAQNVEVGNAYVDGALTLNSLKVAEGGVAAIEDGTLNLLGVTEKDAKEITGKVVVTGSGVLTTNKAAAEAYIPKIEDEVQPAVLYVDRGMKLADGAELVIGGATTQKIALLADGVADPAPATKNATVKIADGGYALVDVTKFLGTKEAVFGDNADVNVEAGELDLINVNKTGEVKLGASVTVGDKGEIDTDSLYLGAKAGDKGMVAINYRDGVVADKTVDARLKGLFTKGASAKELAILNALDKDAYLDTKTDNFNALGNKAFEQATGGNATAGVFNVAYDANAQVTDAIVRHQLAEKTHMGAWADVFYAKNEAKEMYGNSGYSADIYGGVLGFDATFSCGATGGVAIAMGKADAESEGGVLANKLDSDFWGVSVYTAKDFDGLNVKADLGYMDFSNDFSGLGDASDASTVTFGVRGDYTAYQNGAFSVAPHFGLRYTHIDTDAVAFNDAQTMNVFEAPIGVKFAGTFETTGWKVVPSYDFTIVPQFGDKEVEAFGTAGDVTILNGGLVNNVIGIEASKGNLTFGLNGVYGVGGHDRSNTQINANVRYNF